MQKIILLLLGLTLIALVVILAMGLLFMGRGNDQYSNRLMQARIYLQGLAVVLLGFLFYLSR